MPAGSARLAGRGYFCLITQNKTSTAMKIKNHNQRIRTGGIVIEDETLG